MRTLINRLVLFSLNNNPEQFIVEQSVVYLLSVIAPTTVGIRSRLLGNGRL